MTMGDKGHRAEGKPRMSSHDVCFPPVQTASATASHDDQGSSSRGKLNGDDHPFAVQQATEHVAYPLQPAIFVA